MAISMATRTLHLAAQIKTPSTHFGLINCVIPEQELGGLAGFLDGGSRSTVCERFRGREAGRRLCCLIGHGYRDVRTAEGQAVRGNTKADVTASQELKPEAPLSQRPADSVQLGSDSSVQHFQLQTWLRSKPGVTVPP
ncbi:hypothetical protein SRHO_G00311460 [Serrasalmus rhombeus]